MLLLFLHPHCLPHQPVINLGQLTTPYTLMDTLSLLYRYFPSSEVVRFATELIAEPLATLWEKILTRCVCVCLSVCLCSGFTIETYI